MVTKKRKTKKKPNYFNENSHGSSYGKNSGNYNRESKNNTNRTKYQNSFATDRDAYLNSFNNSSDNRRKSTSSVPPSEKSDSSDLDSVHSLPVESTSNRNNQLGQSAALVSYADIAKTANMDKTPMDQWPTITKNDCIDNSSVSTCSSSNSSKSQNSIQTVRSSCNEFGGDEQKQLSYSESLLDDKIILQNGGENFIKKIKKKEERNSESVVKNLLHKSKSVESDNYLGIDQYPALEKTIKKHSGQIENLVPAVVLLSKATTTAIKKQSKQQSKEITAILTETQTIETENNQKNRQPNNVPIFTTTTVNTTTTATAPSLPIFYENSTKRLKKEKINEILVNNSNHRPAVIILNDVDTKINDVNDEITFGFEINKQLLYGDFNEDELLFIESNDQATNNSTDFGYTSSSSSPKDNVSTDDILHQQSNIYINNNNNKISKFEIISSPPQQQQQQQSTTFNSIECISISGAISSSPIDNNKKCTSSVVVDELGGIVVVDTSDLIVNDINSNSSCNLNLISCNNNIEVNRVIVVVDENKQKQQPLQQKEQKKINSVKELNIIYKAPAVDPKFNYNHAKIVDFVGLGEFFFNYFNFN